MKEEDRGNLGVGSDALRVEGAGCRMRRSPLSRSNLFEVMVSELSSTSQVGDLAESDLRCHRRVICRRVIGSTPRQLVG